MTESKTLDPFYGIMLEDCFIHRWKLDGDLLIVDLDFSLWLSNVNYETPTKGEWTCYKRGVLVANHLKWLGDFILQTEA